MKQEECREQKGARDRCRRIRRSIHSCVEVDVTRTPAHRARTAWGVGREAGGYLKPERAVIGAATDELGVLSERGGPQVPAVRVPREQLRLEIVYLLTKLKHCRRLVGVGAGSGRDGNRPRLQCWIHLGGGEGGRRDRYNTAAISTALRASAGICANKACPMGP